MLAEHLGARGFEVSLSSHPSAGLEALQDGAFDVPGIIDRSARQGVRLPSCCFSASRWPLGAYPLVRRLTGRVERLQRQVEALGAGELGARVAVDGNDEVAGLVRSVNRAAERIERLVEVSGRS